LSDQHAAPFGPQRQHGHRRQLMIQPVAQKAVADHQRGLDVAQALVEIRAVLFGHGAQHTGCKACLQIGRQRIHVAIDRVGHPPQRQHPRRAAIRRNHGLRRPHRSRQGIGLDCAATHQKNRFFALNNSGFHVGLMAKCETDHNPDMK